MILPKVPWDDMKSLNPKSRLHLYDRQNGMCPWCGRNLNPDDMAAHHRLLRSQGGTWDLANIIGLHHGCHNVQPGSVHQEPRRAYRLGFMIRTKLLTPAQIPLYSRSAGVWLLANGDGYQRVGNPEASELIAAAGGNRD